MKGKIFKWTAALAVALTLAGGAAGLSPATVSLPDFSITAEAASHYSFNTTTHQLTLSGKFTVTEDGITGALGNYSTNSVASLKLEEGANVTFEESLHHYLPDLQYVYLSNATVNYTDSWGYFLGFFEKLKIAKLDGTIYNGSWGHMFYDCPRLVTADLEISYDSRVIDTLESCFQGCSMLQNIYWNNNFQANLVNVTNMSYMFDGCSSLTYESLMNIARLSNNKLYNVSAMFRGCSSLTEVRLWDLNLSNVGITTSMFEGCSSLETLNLSGMKAENFNFTNPACWQKMFAGCTSLHTLTLPANFQIRSQMWLPNAGAECPDELAGWALSNDLFTTVTEGVTANPAALANQASGVVFKEKVTLYRRGDWIDKGTCYYCDRVNYVLHLFGNVDRDEIVYMNNAKKVKEVWCEEGTVFPDYCFKLFAHRPNLKKVDINNADTSQVGDMSYMFCECTSLVEVNAGKIDTSNVYTMEYMFASCTSLEYFYNNSNGNRWNTKNVKLFDRMFASCTSLREMKADFGSNVITSVEGMFRNCPDLYIVVLDNKGFNLQGVADEKKANMFEKCPSLQMLYLSSNFGDITQNMKLRNDNGGWCDPLHNGIQVSGTTPYAVINTESSWTIYHAEKFHTINLKDVTFTMSQYSTPIPGNMVYSDLVTCDDTQFTIEESKTGWYDAYSGKKLKEQPFLPGGSYYLIIRLEPKFQNRFYNITASDLEQIKIKSFVKYSYTEKQFIDLRAAKIDENGYLELYGVIDSGSGNTPIVQKAYYKNVTLPADSVQRYTDSFANQNVLPCYQLYNIYFAPYAFSLVASTDLLSDAYLSYTGTSTDRYEFSIDGGAYQILDSPRKTVGTGLLPGTQHNVKIRKKDFYIITLAEKNVSTKAPNAPVAGGYLVDNVSHLETGFSRSMVITNCLGIVYYIPVSDLEGYENIKMIIQKETFNETGSECQIEITEVKDYTIETSQYGTEYVFAYDNIAAKEMGSNVYATLYAEKNGSSYIRKINKYSIADYAINQLNATKNPKFATLLADMLNYGAAAQVRFNYNTGNLVNERMSASHLNCLSDPDSLVLKSDSATAKISNPTARFSGKTLMLGNNVSIVYYMMFDSSVNTDNVVLQLDYKMITGQSVTERIPFSEFRLSGDYEGEYRYDFVKIRAKDAAQPVTAKIMVGNQQISNATTYSIQTYAKNMLENTNTQEKDRKIITALMLYCKSAESYFKSL